MSGSLVVLTFFRGTILYLLMQWFQLVLLTLLALQVFPTQSCVSLKLLDEICYLFLSYNYVILSAVVSLLDVCLKTLTFVMIF